jgi:hypothetical protein
MPKFWPRCTPLPPKTRVSQQFAAAIEEHRINDVEAEPEPMGNHSHFPDGRFVRG